MRKLFGTDGIRGAANRHPMTAEMALRVGRAVASFFRDGNPGRIVIGKDTRISGDMLEHALVAGICSAGGNASLAGVIPTPGVAALTAELGASAGIVISASHNPYEDNGIKMFKGDGFKLSETLEAQLEAQILNVRPNPAEISEISETGLAHPIPDALSRYLKFLKKAVSNGFSLEGMKLVLDCGNGATYQAAPALFSGLDAEVEALFVTPDGKNINAGCGSQHPETLIEHVFQNHAAAGLAFDGDGDRLIAVDETGKVISGDVILAICARYLKQQGRLRHNRVVSTVMSNLGLKQALAGLGIDYVQCPVGDRHVMKAMLDTGAVIGGEDSGHMIFLEHHSTGDGMLSALRLLEVMHETRQPLSQLAGVMRVFPQKLVNVPVCRRPELATVPEIVEAIDRVEKQLAGKGRVLVRYSGTQMLCRVMVEAPSEAETQSYCAQIAAVVHRILA